MTTPLPTSPGSFSIEGEMLDLRFRFATLTQRERITAGYVRVRLEGPELEGFGGTGVDDHVRIFLPESRVETVEEMRAAPSREYTPLFWGTTEQGAHYVDLEFQVHGDEGVAGVWADTAELGSVIGIGGPRGSRRIEGTPDGWFLAGDETAIPQIRRYANALPAGAAVRILVEVPDASHEVPIEAPVAVEYLHRGDAAPGSALVAALDALGEADRPGTDPFVFIAAEKAVVRAGRALACDRWGQDPDKTVIKGYWKAAETGSSYHAAH
ncbi:siderophore-interacting protein [Microbacterium indicum]|uniref:siderophore-interacting protein n=1 Tax=Microbacterium indicum TaxID=358100 RepID=UPI00040D55B8|nr:siderophore-interacting protein [Microbacterium indicum]